MAKFNILNRAELLVKKVFECTNSCPKKTRCDIVVELRTYVIKILECVIRANDEVKYGTKPSADNLRRRVDFQNEAIVTIHVLQSLSDICSNIGYITKKTI